MIPTRDGGFAIIGYSFSIDIVNPPALLVLADSMGGWQQLYTYGDSSFYFCEYLVEAREGGLLLGGQAEHPGNLSTDIKLIRTDVDGQEIWSRFIGSLEHDILGGLLQLQDGNFAVFGGFCHYFQVIR